MGERICKGCARVYNGKKFNNLKEIIENSKKEFGNEAAFKFKNPETKETVVSYAQDIPSNVFQKTLHINIGGVEYQADCLYTASFWTGYTWYIILAELICLLLCAGIALVSSKFTSDIYNK